MMAELLTAARAIGARLQGDNVPFDRVTTDSRDVQPGDLFVALPGENFDGHDFVGRAIANGASGALVAGNRAVGVAGNLLLIHDPLMGLGKLAAWWRSRFHLPLIAITGSNGKTTVKEMVASIFRAVVRDADSVLATHGNFNNHIGLPLTLLRLRSRHAFAVVEMGMNHSGEISYLTGLARPTVALINNAHAAHLEGLGSVDAVAVAKGEIFAGLAEGGTAIINVDDSAHAGYWRSLACPYRIVTFGLEQPAQIRGDDVAENGSFTLHLGGESARVQLRVLGRHNVRNALAAAACGYAAGIPLLSIAQGLELFEGVVGRLAISHGAHGERVIDDTYNANPDSMRAALDVLANQPGRRYFVVGDMGELGSDALALHRLLGNYAREKQIDGVYALGTMTPGLVAAYGPGAFHFDSVSSLLASLAPQLDAQACVLVKGSRFMRMERVVEGLRSSIPQSPARVGT